LNIKRKERLRKTAGKNIQKRQPNHSHVTYINNKISKVSKTILLLSLVLLVRRWFVAAVAAAGDGQNILLMLAPNLLPSHLPNLLHLRVGRHYIYIDLL
jgi:hypothetical protein